MPKRAGVAALIQLGLDTSSTSPLYRQLYEQLRDAILGRRLAAGARLPSTRTLARELGVSRNTVMNAFEQLLAEGYLEGKLGAGTYVTRDMPSEPAAVTPLPGVPQALTATRRLSARGDVLRHANVYCSAQEGEMPVPFRPGWPAIDQFPVAIWERLASRLWRNPPRLVLSYGKAAGYRPLREAVAEYLHEARGVKCETDQVIIVSGCQHAFDLAARVLLDPGDAVWIEDPGYLGARAALQASGARLIPVPVDREGLDVAAGIARADNARAAYVSPSHQFPLGVTMSLARRLALLAWANRAGSWVLEDDYDSEFRYRGRPLAAIQAMDSGARVIYIGSFSKVVLPSFRLGYLVAPPDLVDPFTAARAITDRHSSVPDQAVMAAFMAEGHFARHVRRMRTLYRERQEVLLDAAQSELAGLLDVAVAPAGMHLVGWLPPGADDRAASRQAAAHGIDALPLSRFVLEPPVRPGLLLGYASFSEQEIREGVSRLARALRGEWHHA